MASKPIKTMFVTNYSYQYVVLRAAVGSVL